jgi:thiol:disulfide interchange protein
MPPPHASRLQPPSVRPVTAAFLVCAVIEADSRRLLVVVVVVVFFFLFRLFRREAQEAGPPSLSVCFCCSFAAPVRVAIRSLSSPRAHSSSFLSQSSSSISFFNNRFDLQSQIQFH